MIFSLTWLKSKNPPDDWGRMDIFAVYFIFSRSWTVLDIYWRQTSATKNICSTIYCYFWSTCKPPRKKPSTYGSACVLPLLCHIQKSHFWSLLIPWLVGSAVSDVFTVRSANQCTAASIPVFIHLMLLSALGVHVGVPHMCLALRVCVFLQCFIAGRASICLSPRSL